MYRKEKFWIGLWILVFVASIGSLIFSAIVLSKLITLIIFIISFLLLILLAIPFVYWGLAPLNIFFTFVDEGTAKIVVKGGKFIKALIQWESHTFDRTETETKWNVVEEGTEARTTGAVTHKESRHLFGGLRFYGLWPISDIYGYRLRWTSIRENGEASQHDEILDSVMLKDMIYFAEIRGAEEKNKIPLDIGLIITLRVINPYKALFNVQDWLELVLNRIKPLFRERVANNTYDELLVKKQKIGGELWKKLKEEKLIEEFENDYGIKIKEGGIEMKDITPPAIYQKAATQKYLAERESEKRAGETMGAVIHMMATSEGKSPDDIRTEIQGNSKLRKEFRGFCQDLIHRRMAIDGKSYLDIRVTGAEGTEKSLLELISAWRRMPQGGTTSEETEKKHKEDTKKKE